MPFPEAPWEESISIHAPPRGATREKGWGKKRAYSISIHAPPRGATMALATCLAGSGHISIHAPPRGATRARMIVAPLVLFQFTPLREGRPQPACPLSLPLSISIHAPPRGATGRRRCRMRAKAFQFTPLREGRRQKICNFCKSFVQPLQISMA